MQLYLPAFHHRGMNYQQRNRALLECIGGRWERTSHNRKAVKSNILIRYPTHYGMVETCFFLAAPFA
jgi:hypothetical protein